MVSRHLSLSGCSVKVIKAGWDYGRLSEQAGELPALGGYLQGTPGRHDFTWLVQAFGRLQEINRLLPGRQRIRVVVVPMGWHDSLPVGQLDEATEERELVLRSGQGHIRKLKTG